MSGAGPNSEFFSTPSGQPSRLIPAAPVAFVVLCHREAERTHYDLMVDRGETLATWKLPRPPEDAAETPLIGNRIADHRRLYLNYEGPVSGNRGSVTRHDHGNCTITTMEPDRWVIDFSGSRLQGKFVLRVLDAEVQSWVLGSGA